MAPHAGTAGLKVLLAGPSQSDLSEAEAFLIKEGAVGEFVAMMSDDSAGSAVWLTRLSRCMPYSDFNKRSKSDQSAFAK